MSYESQLASFEKDLLKATDPEELHKRAIEKMGDEIIRAVISNAQIGLNPKGRKYPKYSAAYAKLKAKSEGGINGRWLRGVSNAGKTGGMLDEENFRLEGDKAGDIWLIFSSPDEDTMLRAKVHNFGRPLGKGGPRRKREFVGWCKSAVTAYETAMKQVMDDIAAEVSMS